jgi:hypothetical protein
LFIFEGKRIWVYDGFELKKGFPIDVKLDEDSYPKDVRVAVIEKDDNMILISV